MRESARIVDSFFSLNFNDVSFGSPSIGIVVGDAGIWRTTDGGVTWVNQLTNTPKLWGVSFGNATTGTAVGSFGAILRTTDGGATWVSQESSSATDLHDVWFANAHTGTAVGTGGTILRTTDGGGL